MKYAIHFTKQESAERRGRSAGRLTARFAPEADKRQVIVFHFADKRLVAELALHPAARRLAENSAPDREAFDEGMRRRFSEAFAQLLLRRVEPE